MAQYARRTARRVSIGKARRERRKREMARRMPELADWAARLVAEASPR